MKDAKGHGSDPRGGETAHQSGVNQIGLRQKGAQIITGYGPPFDVQINPSERDLRGMAKDAMDNTVRVVIDRATDNLYAWDAGKAIHASIENVMNLDAKHQDNWVLRGGKLLSQRYLPDRVDPTYGPRTAGTTSAKDIKEAAAEVASHLKGRI
jgi:hypothetical protein